ncbi:MAG: FkbM family methyltransferase [Magnetococcales bacterium]|nr:FkbM family methyltransferase [Magnetococcales bacterium]
MSALTSLIDILTDLPIVRILDIGAMYTQKAPWSHLVERGAAELIGFEPDAEKCAELNRIFRGKGTFYPWFIGDGKKATFFETNWAATGSLFRPNQALLEQFNNLAELMTLKAQHPVNTVRLDSIVGLGKVDMIKIDVQGAELMVFNGARQVLASTSLIQTEVNFLPLYQNQPLFADVDRHLRNFGFQFHTFAGLSSRAYKPLQLPNPNHGLHQVIWGDAVYFKNSQNFAKLPSDELLKLALLLHDIYTSYDVVYLLLYIFSSRENKNFIGKYHEWLVQAHPELETPKYLSPDYTPVHGWKST